jgi:hypothetical protein
MYTVTIQKECGCFKRSGEPTYKSYSTKEEAKRSAQMWAEAMNIDFCKKHNFIVKEETNAYIISLLNNDTI